MSGDGTGEVPAGIGGPSGSPTPAIEVAYNLDEVYEASNGIIDHLADEAHEVGLGVFALVVTIGRVLSPTEMTPQQEQAFLKATLDYVGAYFAEGRAN